MRVVGCEVLQNPEQMLLCHPGGLDITLNSIGTQGL